MKSIKLVALLIALLFIVGFTIGCNDESSKTKVKPAETAGDDNGAAQDQGTDKSGAIDDESQSAETGEDGADENKTDEEATESATPNSQETVQDNPCQPIVDEANKQDQAGIKVDEDQFQKDLNECVNMNASVMSEVLAAEEENASKATGSEDTGDVNRMGSDRGCATGCYDRNCPYVNLDKIPCVPKSAVVEATADQPSDSR